MKLMRAGSSKLQRQTWIEFFDFALAAGMEREQINNLQRRGWFPFPKQVLFHAAARAADKEGGPEKIGFGGARGPGKTSTTFAQVTLDDCQRVAGLKWLFLRQTQKSARESFDDLRHRILRHTPHDYKQTGILRFPNGSRVILGGFANDKDIRQVSRHRVRRHRD